MNIGRTLLKEKIANRSFRQAWKWSVQQMAYGKLFHFHVFFWAYTRFNTFFIYLTIQNSNIHSDWKTTKLVLFVVFVCVVGWLIRFGLCGFFHLYDIRYKNHLTGVSCAVLCNITVIHCFSAQNSFRFKLEKKDRKSLSWFLHCLKCNTFFVT